MLIPAEEAKAKLTHKEIAETMQDPASQDEDGCTGDECPQRHHMILMDGCVQ
jgi:hypothetical protein